MTLHLDNLPRTIYVEREEGKPRVVMIDQRALPGELTWIRTADWRVVVDAVKTLAVRGAPAIGVAGAAAVMLAAFELAGSRVGPGRRAEDFCSFGGTSFLAAADGWGFRGALEAVASEVAEARPTAVNLSWAVRRALQTAFGALDGGQAAQEVSEALYGLVEGLIVEDEAANRRIGAAGAALLRDRARALGRPLRILTHCNAGSLATAFYGTALGVVYAAAAEGLVERVWADETRPVGQGARLTVWELARAGVPATLLCDNMAASLMAAGRIDAVVVGADRIAANGDVANKIGTLGVAVLAHHFAVPFFVAAPVSTVDVATADGAAIPIEERDGSEVCPHPPEGVALYNPAFDVTPASLIAAIVTEEGAFAPSALASALVM
ncbi:S-methyl-5-thioribose-1-phosphate isomerase [Adlercreutzia muris]|uniref:S-methyl-5-thioribose-1-phosphate isomerase n=1 Tax=Adlercreutzia muris TaxID=1796610 RepID=UPI003512B1F0